MLPTRTKDLFVSIDFGVLLMMSATRPHPPPPTMAPSARPLIRPPPCGGKPILKDKGAYPMDPANGREALIEAEPDEGEAAGSARSRHTTCPDGPRAWLGGRVHRSAFGLSLSPLNALAQATAETEASTDSDQGQWPGHGRDGWQNVDVDRVTGTLQDPGAEMPGSRGEPDIRESFATEDGVADDGRARDIGWIHSQNNTTGD